MRLGNQKALRPQTPCQIVWPLGPTTRLEGSHRCEGTTMYALLATAVWTRESVSACNQPLLSEHILGVQSYISKHISEHGGVARELQMGTACVLEPLAAVTSKTYSHPFFLPPSTAQGAALALSTSCLDFLPFLSLCRRKCSTEADISLSKSPRARILL